MNTYWSETVQLQYTHTTIGRVCTVCMQECVGVGKCGAWAFSVCLCMLLYTQYIKASWLKYVADCSQRGNYVYISHTVQGVHCSHTGWPAGHAYTHTVLSGAQHPATADCGAICTHPQVYTIVDGSDDCHFVDCSLVQCLITLTVFVTHGCTRRRWELIFVLVTIWGFPFICKMTPSSMVTIVEGGCHMP